MRAAAAVSAEIQKAWKLMHQRPATWQAMRQYRPATRTWAISDRKTKRTEQSMGQVMHSVQRRPLQDLGLGENSITLDYTYRKSSSVSPSYLEKIKSWYGESGQILFSDGASYQNVLGAAASAAGGALIANGGVEEYANAVLKVRLDYGTAVYNALKEMKQKDFEGGKIVTRGVTDQEISLEWNQDAVPYFTEDQYRALCAKFSAEDFSIPDGDALSSPDQYKLSCVSVQKVK